VGEQRRRVAVRRQYDSLAADGAPGRVQCMRAARRRKLGDGRVRLQIDTAALHKLLQHERDQLVRPQTRRSLAQGRSDAARRHAVLLQLLLVRDDGDVARYPRRYLAKMRDLLLRLVHRLVCPEGAAASDVAPLTWDRVVVDVAAYGGDVLEFEFRDVAASVEEERLAMAAVLYTVASADMHRGNAGRDGY
jgi:hypothetical protein